MLELKCKIGSLAAEAKFIRNVECKEKKEARRIEAKWPDSANYSAVDRMKRALSLRDHRIGPVRREARNAQLAYAFLRGKPYLLTERSLKLNPEGKPINKVHWDEVEKIALRFTVDDERAVKQRFAEWKDAKLTPEQHGRLVFSDQRAATRLEKQRRAYAKADMAKA